MYNNCRWHYFIHLGSVMIGRLRQKKVVTGIMIGFIFLLSLESVDSGLELTGFVTGELGTPLEDGVTDSAELHARVKGRKEFGRLVSWVEVESRLQDERGNPSFEVREAAVRARWGLAELTIGQQIVIWGTADEFNPTDFINPEDFTKFMTLSKADRKLGLPMLRSCLLFGVMEVELILTAMLEGHSLPESGSPWEPTFLRYLRDLDAQSEAISLEEENPPPITMKHLESAVRLRWLVGGCELGAVYYHGHDRYPYMDFETIPGVDTPELRLTPSYARMDGYGVEIFAPVKSWGIRSEAAILDSRTFNLVSNPQELAISKQFQGVIGIDRTIGDDLYLNGQFVYWDYLDEIGEITEPNSLSVLTLSSSYTMLDGDLKMELDLLAEPESDGYLIMPSVFYRISAHFSTETGVILMDGDADSYLGAYAHNDYAFGSLKFQW